MFTAKHFTAIAEVIHQTRVKIKDRDTSQLSLFDEDQQLAAMGEFTHQLIQMFKKDNPKFDQFRFIEAASKDLVDENNA